MNGGRGMSKEGNRVEEGRGLAGIFNGLANFDPISSPGHETALTFGLRDQNVTKYLAGKLRGKQQLPPQQTLRTQHALQCSLALQTEI